MSNAPITHIDPAAFRADPYPDLAKMRTSSPITYVPELDATLITRRDEIYTQEKRTDVFSSLQPDGLMTRLMGENMMRKDGTDHMAERRALFPALSPKTVRAHWLPKFQSAAAELLETLHPLGQCDLVADFAMPLSGEALKAITGLTNMRAAEMDRVSQGMIDGCANYASDPVIEANCHNCTASIDTHIDARINALTVNPDRSALSVQLAAGLSMETTRANIKLIISGGQNEPRDAIAGTIYALLANPDERAKIDAETATWANAFDEYLRWNSPIGMSPRRIARDAAAVDTTADDQQVIIEILRHELPLNRLALLRGV